MCVAPEMWIYDKANHNSLQPKPTKPTNPPNFPLDIQSLPPLTQREMSRRMGISLGKLNYCLTELARKGFLKVHRFKDSSKKTKYVYVLTPRGLEEKAADIVSIKRVG